MSDPSTYDPAVGTRIGRYRIEGRIAVGGMAEIFLARDPGGGRVVVKRLTATRESARDRIKMFIHEGRVATLLNHENIVRVFEVDLDGQGSCFMAMEYLAGWDLEDVCYRLAKQGEYLPIPVVLRLMIDACRGLHAAHIAEGPDGIALELVHRDISPTNLFVNADGVLKILDFGIAKTALQTHHTATGIVKGKPSYMSPEQIEDGAVDQRSDIFSLGIVLHELLTGERLFWRERPLDVLSAITSKPVPRPRREHETVPPELVALAMRALERDPDRRIFSADQLADGLEALGGVAERREVAGFLESTFHEQEAPEPSPSATGSYLAISRWIDAGTDRILAQSFASDSDASTTGTLPEAFLPDATRIPPSSSDPDGETMIVPSSLPLAEAVAATAVERAHRRRRFVAAAVVFLVVGAFAAGALILGTHDESVAQPSGVAQAARGPDDAAVESAVADSGVAAAAAPTDDPEHDPEPITAAETQGSAESAPSVEGPTTPQRVSRRPPKKKRATGRKSAKPAVGRLSLSVKPWANIYYRGKLLGASPLVEHEFPAGRVELKFVNPGKGLEKSVTFNVAAGEHLRDKVALE